MSKDIVIEENKLKEILAKSLMDSIGEKGYSNPTKQFAKEVVEEFEDEIKTALRKALSEIVPNEEFNRILVQEFKHKVAKMLVGDLQGAVEKAVNNFRQDPRLKADMIKAIENIIEEQQ